MPQQQYLNGINVTSLSLGLNSGSSLTTGTGNLLLGANAGKDLTTGSQNTIVGSYAATGETDLQGGVVLSNGNGAVACRWDASGNVSRPAGVDAF